MIRLNDADEAECRAGGFPSGAVALEASIRGSDLYFEYRRRGQTLAWFGAKGQQMISDVALVWMLSAPEFQDHKIAGARESIKVTRYFLSIYGTLVAYVHLDHKVSRNWLHWLGYHDMRVQDNFIWMRCNREGWKWAS